MRRGSAPVSGTAVLLAFVLAVGLLTALLPLSGQLLFGVREGLKEKGERSSELIRIYIHSVNETELNPPVITIINGHDRDSILTDYVVVARDGRVLRTGKMGGSINGIRLPAGSSIDLRPQDFGLSYATFAAMADEVKAIYIRTAEGNSFGSSYGPPPKVAPDVNISVSQTSEIVLVIGTTSTSYSLNITLPIGPNMTGMARIVKNVILVDSTGAVRGGAEMGRKWSDGSFDANKIPDELAQLTSQVDEVPIGAYYVVKSLPSWIMQTNIISSCFYVYSTRYPPDACPAYVEMLEYHAAEYYTPGSAALGKAYWLRFSRTLETVYIPDSGRVVVITRQEPLDVQYPIRVPGVQEFTVSTIPYTITYWDSGNLLLADFYDRESYDYYNNGCQGSTSCSGTVSIPIWPGRMITEVRFSAGGEVAYHPRYVTNTDYSIEVRLTGPWGTRTFTSREGSMTGSWPADAVGFSARIYNCAYYDDRQERWVKTNCRKVWITVTVKVVNPRVEKTATATLPFPPRDWLRNAVGTTTVTTITNTYTYTSVIVKGQLSGDMFIHNRGKLKMDTPQDRLIKVNAPIIVLNYVYSIAGAALPPPPPSSGGGGGGGYGIRMSCTLEGSTSIPSPSDGGSGSSGDSSGGTQTQPLRSLSGGSTGLSYRQQRVTYVARVICRPI